MKKYVLPVIILLMSLLYIFVIPAQPVTVKILFKLIPMWLIIAYAFLNCPNPGKRFHWMLLIGLFFCMLGDGLLIWFVVGLSAFLIGHLFYIAGFMSKYRYSLPRFLTIIPIALFSFFMGWQLLHALIRDDNAALIARVLLYICVISAMTWTAIMTGNKWIIAGGLLFTLSDSILSWNMFVAPVTYAGPLIMITYYGAQFCIATSLHSIQHHSSLSNETFFLSK